MKKLWLHFVRIFMRIGFFFYFKKIEVHGLENVPKNQAVLFLGNHQNALLDPLLIATKSGRFSYFLTRAAVFKKPLVSKFLRSLQMLPVYRVRDGWNNLTNNNAIFNKCIGLFKDKEAVVIFPEGSHNLARRVRPLSKGFTRIVFDTLETFPETDIMLVPVGLNYMNATEFPDSASLFFGKPISAKSFVSENRNEDVLKLKTKIRAELSELTTHIAEDNYEADIAKLNTLNVNYLKPKAVNDCINSEFKTCTETVKPSNSILKKFFKFLLILNIFFPYILWKTVLKSKVSEPEFIATFRFAIAITLVPIYVILVSILVASLFSATIGLLYFIVVLVVALLAVKL